MKIDFFPWVIPKPFRYSDFSFPAELIWLVSRPMGPERTHHSFRLLCYPYKRTHNTAAILLFFLITHYRDTFGRPATVAVWFRFRLKNTYFRFSTAIHWKGKFLNDNTGSIQQRCYRDVRRSATRRFIRYWRVRFITVITLYADFWVSPITYSCRCRIYIAQQLITYRLHLRHQFIIIDQIWD